MSAIRPIAAPATRTSGLTVFLLFFYSLIAPSPIWPAIGIRGFMLLALLCVTLFVQLLTTTGRTLSLRFLAQAAALFALALVPAYHWSAPLLAIYPIFLASAVLLVSQANAAERNAYVDLASRFLLVLLVGAFIGYLLSSAGASPLGRFDNTDGRTNYFFYSTFSNTFEEGFIRPSGIYDEPGAFSFFICMVAYLREVTGRGRAMTYALLLLGFITFSIMHLIFFILFVLATQVNLWRLLRFGALLAMLVAMLVTAGAGDVIQDKVLSRLELTDDGAVAGDTRSLLLLNAAVVLSTVEAAPLMGADSDCTLNAEACIEKFGAMGENLLSPLVSQGLFLSWPYYLFLLAGIVALARGRRGLLFFAVALMFVQRPYLLNLGYSVFGVLAWTVHRTSAASAAIGKPARARRRRSLSLARRIA